MSGVETDPVLMQQTALRAATIGDQLRGVMGQLDLAMSGLSTMDGQIKNPFWRGHRDHLEAVTQLCSKLHRMSEGITTSKAAYQSQDSNSQDAFSQLAAGGALDVTKL